MLSTGAERADGTQLQPSVMFQHFALFADAVNNADTYVPMRSNRDDVEAGAFVSGKIGHLIVLNKGTRSFDLPYLEAPKALRLTAAIQLAPRRGVPLAQALQSETDMERSTLEGRDLDAGNIPPYSITRFRFDWE